MGVGKRVTTQLHLIIKRYSYNVGVRHCIDTATFIGGVFHTIFEVTLCFQEFFTEVNVFFLTYNSAHKQMC